MNRDRPSRGGAAAPFRVPAAMRTTCHDAHKAMDMGSHAPPALRRAASVLLFATLLGGCGGETAAPPGTPVVLVSIDTLRADRLGIYGYQGGSTPAIDSLAADGVVFDRAWANVPLTLPSHASMFTGLLPPTHGVRDNLGYTLDGARHPTLAARLAARDYATGGFVSSFVLRGATGIAAGFASWDDAIERREGQGLGSVERPGAATVESAVRWLDEVGTRPFLLFLHLFEPHAPYAAPEPFRSAVADPYAAEIAAADAAFGRLLDELRRRHLYDRALVVLTADHGEGLGDHGEQEHGILLYREALQVPLVIKLPGNARAGTRSDRPASLVDLLPTLAGRLGLPVEPTLAGRDLFAEVADERILYAETFYPRIHLGWSELRSAIDQRFQYIEGPDPELYSLADDPAQRNNLLRTERRATAALARALEAIPPAFSAPGQAADPETLRKLAALGYLTAGSGNAEETTVRPDPKAEIAVLGEVQAAIALAREGQLAASIAACRAILDRHPGLLDVRLQLAWNLAALGATDEAVRTYQEVAQRSPQQLHAVAIEVARLELRRGRLDAAAEQARLAETTLPDEANLILGEVALARGATDEATATARRLLDQRPASPPVGALFLLARSLAAGGDLPAAVAALDRARAEVATGRTPALAGLEATYGDLLARSGQVDAAEAAFRREIASFPQTYEAYVGLAYLFAASGRPEAIGPTLEALAATDPRPESAALAATTAERLGNARVANAYRQLAEQRQRSVAQELGRSQ
jgi:choline-sulfatase